MADYIFTMQGVTKVHPPDKKVVENLYLSFLPGAKIGIIGVNGTGKSTVLRIMAGVDTNFTGEAWKRAGLTVGYLEQEPDLGDAKTVREAVEEGVKPVRDLLREFEELSMKFSEPMSDDEMTKLLEKQGVLQDKIDAADGWNLEHTLELAMDALRLPPADADPKVLSGGEKRRVALCRLLLQRPDMLLLDEPTNHLDAESVAWLQGHLQAYPGAVILVTHDRYFLDNVVEWILELDHGKALPFKGNYSEWLDNKAQRLEKEEKSDSSRRKKIQRELEWVRASPKARQAKSKARLEAFDTLVAEAGREQRDGAEIKIPPGPRLGRKVIEVHGIKKAYGDKLLYEDLSFSLPPGAILGIVGANGAGKTTLFRMLVGEEQPDAGHIEVGETVKLSYVDQSRADLKGDASVYDEVSGGTEEIDVGGGRTVRARQYVGWFNFKGSDQQKKVGALSGGERNRVHLAKLLRSGGNVLLLDEPTNDIDVETLQSLEQAILEFPGCCLIVSHDRWYLDRLCTHILGFEGDSSVVFFEGGYSDYAADKKKRLGDDADVPRRIKYRKLTRV
ncbi:MAG: energy-dependent translational throttle protein EttA [Sandaracinaceae bacterium]|jgi:sulfate-transporting ATPase|nr:energy-dependent translational throttle protein EttA [Sandaracinaceae bacterium]MBP7681206.1 energy-dependent translational throttle protein EttA [Deltaproteobacteria bacterium]MBK7154896.1 energy-dependent translational throttle protein EttA [Sandaracinaceae bacterium]MBK7772965.1 energy-dependent translational throttle protein EttA [Sandaracinaceae bacterium]MBK8407176.1 energy-dependent translational throttle protein EttA [Sandaracinaceae bacterium]